MKNTAHTPGPWHIGMRPGPMVYGELGEQVADCRGLDEAGHNARLIAALPDLLARLEDLIDEVTQGEVAEQLLTLNPETIQAVINARASIAKATKTD